MNQFRSSLLYLKLLIFQYPYTIYALVINTIGDLLCKK